MTLELPYRMNRSTKAALISALVFPGAGHIFLRKMLPAVLLTTVTFAAVYVLMSSVIQQANTIAEQILSGELQADIGSISNLVATPKDESSTISLATLALGIAWVVGVFDAWRVGRSQQIASEKQAK